MRYVICYDIGDDRRRKRIADILDAYGDRLQHSVFEIVATRKVIQICLKKLEVCINPDEDNLAVYAICASCDASVIYFGTGASRPRTGEEKIFLV